VSESTDLPVFLANYGQSFAQTAYLLTGDADRGRELAVGALVTAGRRWSTVRWNQPVQAVLRELYKSFLSGSGAAPEAYALSSLPPAVRAVVVARFHDGLPTPHAAAITGLPAATLDEEARQAAAYLRATHPGLFTTPPETTSKPPEDERPSPADAPPRDEQDQKSAAQHPSTPWAAPWTPPGSTPEALVPSAPEATAGSAPGAEAGAAQGAAAGSTPWTVPARPWDAAADDDDPNLRAALIRLAAAEMPHIHLSEQVLRRIGRRRRIRVATWATISVGTVGAFVALIVAAATAVVDSVDRTLADPGTLTRGTVPLEMDLPDELPAKFSTPVKYAHAGYCPDTANSPTDPQPCGQWRLTTTAGTEWRLPGAGAGHDGISGVELPLAVSQDGRRLAYRDNQGSYVVRDLPTGAVKRIDMDDQQITPSFTSSPNGRYWAVAFEDVTTTALLDFDTGVTRYTTGTGIDVLAVRNDGSPVISQQEDVDDVPGHDSVTTIELRGARVYAGGYRVDPDLVSYGGALSPDGTTLALVSKGAKLVTMDVRTGRITGPRTALEDYEVIKVERWLGPDKVLVRQWDDEEDEMFLTQVDVRLSTATEYLHEATGWLDYDSPLGALEE
jgi:hypothetical protein